MVEETSIFRECSKIRNDAEQQENFLKEDIRRLEREYEIAQNPSVYLPKIEEKLAKKKAILEAVEDAHRNALTMMKILIEEEIKLMESVDKAEKIREKYSAKPSNKKCSQ